jgi:hypothetical protein
MSIVKEIKLKQLYQLLPEDVVAPSSWLTSHDYSAQLLYKYVESGWLEKVSRGAYIRANSTVTWQSVVLGLQKEDKNSFIVGGLSALNLLGFAHYLPLGGEKTMLYGKDKVPSWIKGLKSADEFSFFKKPFFKELGITTYNTHIRDLHITISTPERAIFELLYLVEKDGMSFSFVAEIFEGLTTLRPTLLNELLFECKSIKVKRLFLYLAHHYNFAWISRIDEDKLNLGVGKMQIVKNGTYDKTYKITVPKDFS